MAHTKVRAIPEGMHSVTPSLTVRGAAAAIDFYKKAFGAVEVTRAPDPTGKLVWHASLRVGDSHVFLADEFPDMGGKSPQALGGSPVTIWLYLDDVDATFASAVAAGGKAAMPLMDMFWGDRCGKIVDPWGHEWMLAQHVKDMTPEEMQKAQDEMVANMSRPK